LRERVLIADRSEALRRGLRAPLEAQGFAVSEARDSRSAYERLRARPHDVAFVDVELTGGGLELLDAVKTDPDLAGIPVVLMSTDLADGSVLDGLERGAIDCLRKPVEPIEAVVRAKAALRISHLTRHLREGDERLTELAATDDLTGLLARRFLESHLRGLVAAAGRHGRPLSLAMIDVDRFKSANDDHGHAVGDFVLRTVVERMQSRLRQEDLLGRWGGDEFLLILPDVEFEGALTAAEGLRETVEETEVSVDGERIPVTVSIGVASWARGDTPEELTERADGALYEAKAAGRNSVHGEGVRR
jgi:two-component system cell cycle response regulator